MDNEKATYDLGIGNVERGNNQINAYEVYAHYWADLTDKSNDYGVTVMNNAKYGWDKPNNNTLRLTLLHTPKTQRGYRYQDKQDQGYHTFTYSLVGHAGGLQKAQTYQKAEKLNQRIKAFSAPKHAGTLGKSFSLASSSNASVAIKALKKAEVSDEYVVRVYERDGKSVQDAVLTFAADIVSAVEADGTEKTIGQASFNGKQLNVSIKPNSIKTYKVKLAKQAKKAQKVEQMALNFDKVCATWNEMTRESNFEGNYAYAAELLPAELTVNRIPFRLENKALLNGMKCEGDTLTLPAGHKYNRLYILAASATPANESVKGTFRVGKTAQEIRVPSYTGFIGQWEHTGHTVGYMDETEVAYVGTHRHSTTADEPYEFTYMFKHAIDIPAKATEIILPNAPEIVLFAATLVEEAQQPAEALSELFRLNNEVAREELPAHVNLLKPEHIKAWTGAWTEEEKAHMEREARRLRFRLENKPEHLLDGKRETIWYDTKGLPSYVEFDLGTATDIKGWEVQSAAFRNRSTPIASCFLMGRNSETEEWKTLDHFAGNKKTRVDRFISQPAKVRYLKFMVVQPSANSNGGDTRVGELVVH
jgi:alpha-mannosidase